jgi:DNA-binding NarL/FixJ family response regulator
MKKRIFIACGNERLRSAVLLRLDGEPDMVVVGITDRLPGLVTQVDVTQPDVLMLEWDLPYEAMAGLFAEIHKLKSPPQILILSSRPEDEQMMLAAGADYFIAKNAPPDSLFSILHMEQTPKTEIPESKAENANSIP